ETVIPASDRISGVAFYFFRELNPAMDALVFYRVDPTADAVDQDFFAAKLDRMRVSFTDLIREANRIPMIAKAILRSHVFFPHFHSVQNALIHKSASGHSKSPFF